MQNEPLKPPANEPPGPPVAPLSTEPPTEPPAFDITALMTTPELQTAIQAQVQEGLKKALQGQPPRANTVPLSATQKTEFERMTYKERLQLFKSDPQTYHKLVKGAV